MKNLLFVIFIISVLLSGCAKSLRYSHDEIKSFDQTVQEHIKNGEVGVGMSKLQVRYAWGGPHNIVVLPPNERGEERVQWVYRKFLFLKTRLIFTADKLTEIISGEFGATK